MTPSSEVETLIKHHCIVLTGGIASGKSTIAQMIRGRGFLVFDADQCARVVVQPGHTGLEKLSARFGPRILQTDGTLDRVKMKQLMTHDASAKRDLDAILHPLIREEFIREIQGTDLLQRPRTFFYEAALIHETHSAGDFKETWCAFCPSDIQQARLIARSGGKLTESDAQALINTQMPITEKARISSKIIDTSQTLAQVRAEIERLLASE